MCTNKEFMREQINYPRNNQMDNMCDTYSSGVHLVVFSEENAFVCLYADYMVKFRLPYIFLQSLSF